jgi:hypothetical protein
MMKSTITILASTALAESGESGSVDVSGIDELSVYLDISAASGTEPTIDVVIQDSPDGTNWYDHTTFSQKTAVGKDAKRISNFGKFMRAKYTIAGTNPSFTAGIVAVGV